MVLTLSGREVIRVSESDQLVVILVEDEVFLLFEQVDDLAQLEALGRVRLPAVSDDVCKAIG